MCAARAERVLLRLRLMRRLTKALLEDSFNAACGGGVWATWVSTHMPHRGSTVSQRRVVAGYAGNLGEHAVDASVGLLNAGAAGNAFYLAQHEFRDLAAPADWGLLQRLGVGHHMRP